MITVRNVLRAAVVPRRH